MKPFSLSRRRDTLVTTAAMAFVFAMPIAPSAHVLDQYLQASRIELQRDAVRVEIDLTPGVEIATPVFFAINTNRDGTISDAECRAYANQVLRALALVADDRPLTLSLTECTAPTYDEMRGGTGTIRVAASSRVRTRSPGRHRLFFRNQHEADRAIFVVNALVPAVRDITIDRQERDRVQREIRLDYTVAGKPPVDTARGWALPMLFGGIVTLMVGRRLTVRRPQL
jgi:hypothetical protein